MGGSPGDESLRNNDDKSQDGKNPGGIFEEHHFFAGHGFVVIAALNQLGIQTASLIAIIGVAGLAIGLALIGQFRRRGGLDYAQALQGW